MTLSELKASLETYGLNCSIANDNGCRIDSIADDSRNSTAGSLFFALKGGLDDGAKFIPQALESGAAAVCIEKGTAAEFSCPTLIVENVRAALALSSHLFYGEPAKRITLTAVTGTNGKTSVAWLVSGALSELGERSGYIGTLGIQEVSKGRRESLTGYGLTTPGALALAKALCHFLERGIEQVVIEVSSHAAAQHRSFGIDFDGAVLTNITRDHLDYHGTMEDYVGAKELLFTRDLVFGKKKKFALINCVDDYSRAVFGKVSELSIESQALSAPDSTRFSVVKSSCNISSTTLSLSLDDKVVVINSRLVGSYNVENLFIAASTLCLLGFEPNRIAASLSKIPPVPGRLEQVGTSEKPVFVDYAHTPDALSNALTSLREIHQGTVTTVFGCGGDRDKGKRPLMAKAAEEHSDKLIITSDNPRTEDPLSIIEDIKNGLRETSSDLVIEADRRKAIELALKSQQPGELILIAGKGHEDYQEINGVRHPFSDQEIIRRIGDDCQGGG